MEWWSHSKKEFSNRLPSICIGLWYLSYSSVALSPQLFLDLFALSFALHSSPKFFSPLFALIFPEVFARSFAVIPWSILKLTGPSEVRQIIIKGKVLYFNKMFNNWTSSQKRFHRTNLLQYKSVKWKNKLLKK